LEILDLSLLIPTAPIYMDILYKVGHPRCLQQQSLQKKEKPQAATHKSSRNPPNSNYLVELQFDATNVSQVQMK